MSIKCILAEQSGKGGGGAAVVAKKIEITKYPLKTTYTSGESFDPSGMELTVSYGLENAGAILTTAIVPASACVITPATLTDSTNYVNISYTENGVTVSTRISVTINAALSGIVVTPPTKQSYDWGDSFNTGGLAVQAQYTSGPNQTVTSYTLKIGNTTISNGTVFNTSAFSIGTNIVTVSYTESGESASSTFNITISKKSLTVPTQTGTLTYTGSNQSPTLSNYNATLMEISGNSQANAGTYTATISLKDTSHYQWSDGTITNKLVSWTIVQATGNLTINPSSITLSSKGEQASFSIGTQHDGTVSFSTKKVSTLGNKAIGSTVQLNVDGTSTDFIVIHQGKPGGIYDDSCDGTWLLMKKSVQFSGIKWNSTSSNSVGNSDIHNYLNGTFLNSFDADIQTQIKQVKLPYIQGEGIVGTLQTGINGLSCKIFLLSAPEVNCTASGISSGEGTTLDYFKDCASNGADSKRVSSFWSITYDWWLRSPNMTDNASAWYIDKTGACVSKAVSNSLNQPSFRPALILPSTFYLDEDSDSTDLVFTGPNTSGQVSVASNSDNEGEYIVTIGCTEGTNYTKPTDKTLNVSVSYWEWGDQTSSSIGDATWWAGLKNWVTSRSTAEERAQCVGKKKYMTLSDSLLGLNANAPFSVICIGADQDGDKTLTFHTEAGFPTQLLFNIDDSNDDVTTNALSSNYKFSIPKSHCDTFANICSAKDSIKTITKTYCHDMAISNSANNPANNTIAAKVWIPSACEMGFTEHSLSEDGTEILFGPAACYTEWTQGGNSQAYSYYTNDASRKKLTLRQDGTFVAYGITSNYWLRTIARTKFSPPIDICAVSTTGQLNKYKYNDEDATIRFVPAFTIG